jgi:hypothetical protein
MVINARSKKVEGEVWSWVRNQTVSADLIQNQVLALTIILCCKALHERANLEAN